MKPEARMGLAENQATPLTGIPPKSAPVRVTGSFPKGLSENSFRVLQNRSRTEGEESWWSWQLTFTPAFASGQQNPLLSPAAPAPTPDP